MTTKRRGGFNAMDPDKVAEITRAGNRKLRALGLSHQFTSETAREAGRLGGLASKKRREPAKPVQQNWHPKEES